MSVLHVRQVKDYLKSNFVQHVDFSEDEKKMGEEELEKISFSRALAAFYLCMSDETLNPGVTLPPKT